MSIRTEDLPAETILRAWLADKDLTLCCGDWANGAVMEVVLKGRSDLTVSGYGCASVSARIQGDQQIDRLIGRKSTMTAEGAPRLAPTESVLRGAITLRGASLVIHRRGLLVEFKTEYLRPGLDVTVDGDHRGWQVGPYEGHHCHLSLDSLVTVQSDAEHVSWQGGGLDYTVWFLTAGDCDSNTAKTA